MNTAVEYGSQSTVSENRFDQDGISLYTTDLTGLVGRRIPRERHAEDERRGAGGLLPGG